jgi:5'-3' exonuclease
MAKQVIDFTPCIDTTSLLHVIDVSGVMRANDVAYGTVLSAQYEGETLVTNALFGLLKLFNKYGFNADYAFCFDRRSKRKDTNPDYKLGRKEPSDPYKKQNALAQKILQDSGFLVLVEDGYEADDFVAHAALTLKDNYDYVIIHGNDYDLTHLIDEKVYFAGCTSNISDVSIDNYESVLGYPYNTTALYKSTVGDGSDRIKGIYKFGKVAFANMVAEIRSVYGEDLSFIGKTRVEESIIREFITDEVKLQQALDSYELVRPTETDKVITDEFGRFINYGVLQSYMEQLDMKSILRTLKKYNKLQQDAV